MGGRERGIAEGDAGDVEGGAVDAEVLHVAVGQGIGEQLVFDCDVELARGEQIFQRVADFIYDSAGVGESAIEVGDFLADGVGEFAVGKPRKIVEVDRNARRFFELEGYGDAFAAGLEGVVHLGKHAGLQKAVGGRLQIRLSDLRTFFKLG